MIKNIYIYIQNLIFCFKFTVLFILLNYKIISLKYFLKMLKEMIINSGPIFIKIIQLVLVSESEEINNFFNEILGNPEKSEKSEKSSKSKVLSLNENKDVNILYDLLDSVYPSKNIDKILIDGKYYNVKNNYSLGSGSVAYVYLIENYKDKGTVILKQISPLFSYNINISINRAHFFLQNLKFLFYFSKKNSNLKKYILNIKITDSVKESIVNLLKKQTDMIRESKNQIKFYNIFKNNKKVNVPEVYYYDENNIVMEYKEGIKINDYLKNNPTHERFAILLIKHAINEMIKNKFIHCDLHYGNLLFNLKNNKLELNLIDFGIVKEINNNQKMFLEKAINKRKKEYLIEFCKSITNVDIENSDINKSINLINNETIDFGNLLLNFKLLIEVMKKTKGLDDTDLDLF